MQRRLEECRSCKANVFWARTAFNHRPSPVDWEPTDTGNILIEDNGGRLVAVVLPPGDERIAAETTYATHFTTCPDGDRWRKRPLA